MTLFDPKRTKSLIHRLEQLTPESRALWGKLNVGEMLCHCLDGSKMAFGGIDPTDRSNVFTRKIVKYLVIYLVPIPKGAPAAPEIDPQMTGTKPIDFDQERQLLIAEVMSFGDIDREELKGRHNVFGKLTPDQWARLGYKHLDHHLKQFGV